MSSLLFWGGNCFNSLPHQDDLNKRMNRITATWRNECFGKMDDHNVHTIPNHHPTKMAFKYVPQPTATTFAFSSVFILLLWSQCLIIIIFSTYFRFQIPHVLSAMFFLNTLKESLNLSGSLRKTKKCLFYLQ